MFARKGGSSCHWGVREGFNGSRVKFFFFLFSVQNFGARIFAWNLKGLPSAYEFMSETWPGRLPCDLRWVGVVWQLVANTCTYMISLSKSPFFRWSNADCALFPRYLAGMSYLVPRGKKKECEMLLSEPRRDIETERSWLTLAVCIVRISVAPQVSLEAVSGHVPGPALRTSSDVLKC